MKVVVTGGAGFLGRGILRRVYDRKELDWDVTVYSRDEMKQQQCRERWPNAKYVLGDVTNYARMCNIFPEHDLVIHAAAVKFIPEAEMNVMECIDVNVGGSNCVFEAAASSGVQQVVAISTDKACAPINVYGMTKSLMERMVGEYARYSNGTKYTACRYGNVVGSTGSVIPLFQKQARESGWITVTDPEMTRYWISVDQAIDLVLECIVSSNGDILIPHPASMRMGELAHLIAEPYHALVKEIGLRPGEKKHEQLLHQQESVRAYFGIGSEPHILKPVDSAAISEPFMLSSNSPSVWLSPERMEEMIEDAALV